MVNEVKAFEGQNVASENLLKNNAMQIVGKMATDFEFSHTVYGENFYNCKVEVSRISSNIDVLPVTISEKLIDMNKIYKDTFVKIIGQLRSYNSYDETTKRNRLVLTVFAKDLSMIESVKADNPNDVVISGFICKKPVYRTTPFGREICDLLVAVNRTYNKSDYIPAITWGRNAKFASNLDVGDKINIVGRMQSRKYEKKLDDFNILDRTAYEVSVGKIEVIKVKELNETME